MPTIDAPKILFVDDDPNVLAAMQRSLRKRYTLDVAASGNEALEIVRTRGPFAVIVADMSMPVMNGVELLEAVRANSPDTVRVMLTGNADQRTAAEAVNRGHVFRFLSKPCPPETLSATLDTALKQHELLANEKALLNQTLKGSLQVLADILATLDAEAFGQAQLRRSLARKLARQLKLDSTWEVEIAALLSDIGLATLPSVLREKMRTQQPLSLGERQLLERLPEFSSRLLASIPRLETVSQNVLYQNKNYDGSGFPKGKPDRAEIPIGARILRVVNDVVRMHHKGLALADMVASLKAGPERYDPTVVREVPACEAVFQPTPKDATAPRKLALSELHPGCVLRAEVKTAEGNVVMNAGITLNATQLQRLRNFSVLHPVVEPVLVDLPPVSAHAGGSLVDQITLP